ncbi:uncharacterized protein BDV14DRAFT_151033 [Aspergillus stella-maris]|uniref:uncharacterized protein n=1 Tax=Aspergillus stella-maris TaxID=1810926 RepID=UPI003CCD296D
MNESLKSESDSAHTTLQAKSSNLMHVEDNVGHIKPVQALNTRGCNCVKEGDDQGQGIDMGLTYDSNPAVAAGVVRPESLTLAPSNETVLSSPRGRAFQRNPSSPEGAGHRSPLQSNSPASLIFERSVQEDIVLPEISPSIPSHIRTENHIPPVLEASSAAITDHGLDPDSVEIVTHSIHQPATNGPHTDQLLQLPSMDNAEMVRDPEEPQPTSQSPEVNDIRRLSFISFADVVNAENAETGDYAASSESVQRSPGSPIQSATAYRKMSPSPLHSPASSHGLGTSPPTSISTSFQGLELSPHRRSRGADSPLLAIQRPVSPSFSGDVNIETMRQALRRTGSGDMGASRNQPPISTGNDD